MIEYLRDLFSKSKPGDKFGKLEPKVFSCHHHFSPAIFEC
jgi:hypothetical protein